MTIDNIRKNLNNFYAGNSTPEQEEALSRYFAENTDIADEFQADAAMFRAMARATDVPDGLEDRILDATVRRPQIRRWTLGAIAAVAAVLLMVITTPPKISSQYREVNDPAEAEAITMQIAQTLQKSMNKLDKLNNLPL